jgi:hypothetical protein
MNTRLRVWAARVISVVKRAEKSVKFAVSVNLAEVRLELREFLKAMRRTASS